MSPLLSHVCGPAVDPAVVIHRSCIIQSREILQFDSYAIVKIGAVLYLSTGQCYIEYKRVLVDIVKQVRQLCVVFPTTLVTYLYELFLCLSRAALLSSLFF